MWAPETSSAAGAPYEDTPEGLLVRDAWNIALRVAPDVSLPQLVSRARDAT